MANYYTSQSIANYNDNAPVDDGTETEANRTKWATVKDEIGDPLKTLAEAIDTELSNLEGRLFLNGSTSQSTNYTTTAGDLGKVVLATNTITITLLASATATAGHVIAIKNNGTGIVTVDGNGSETIDGATTVLLSPEDTIVLRSDGSNWDMIVRPAIMVLAEQATTSGTSKSFTIPAGAKEIVFMPNGVSSNGTSNFFLQLNSETSGYLSAAGATVSTTGFVLTTGNAAGSIWQGRYVLSLQDAVNNTWVGNGDMYESSVGPALISSAGAKTTSAVASALLFGPANGSDTLDAGAVNVQVKF